jgi:hypothetical protein
MGYSLTHAYYDIILSGRHDKKVTFTVVLMLNSHCTL